MDAQRDYFTAADEIHVGVRFHKRDAPRLRVMADRVRAGEFANQHLALFEGAADAALKQEPLILRCAKLEEAELIGQGFVNLGVVPTALEVFGSPKAV